MIPSFKGGNIYNSIIKFIIKLLNLTFMFSIIALEVTFLAQSQISKCIPHCQQSRLLSSAK